MFLAGVKHRFLSVIFHSRGQDYLLRRSSDIYAVPVRRSVVHREEFDFFPIVVFCLVLDDHFQFFFLLQT